MLPKNRIKARLILATEKEFKKISEARSSDSESEGESHKGSVVVERQEPQCLTEESKNLVCC